ncbi:MAG: ACP S-malonyltransferase [Rhodothermales bacterium]|nr:ACP S-malonyltransferase [Rhodothermales bacterium]MBO6778786.1 ACP S-malonyltransferase [Rhodothermales bacterium]
MATTALLFPGQGSQYVGMGQDLFQDHESARGILERADATLGFGLTEVMFGSGDEAADNEALKQTDNTQPALYAHSMAVMAVLKDMGLPFDMTAGHSLGEYSALAAAGALSFEDGLLLVRERGRLMAEAGQKSPGTMAAIIGMDDADVEAACEAVDGVVQPANFNSPGQVVISGSEQAVAAAMEQATERGARRVIPLPVSGAFHSPLMEHARDGLAAALEGVSISVPSCPVYLNVNAQPETDPEAIRRRLLEQLMAPVRWSQTLNRMQKDGTQTFVEVGAGRVLSGLVKRTLGRDATTIALGTSQDIASYTVES